MHNLNDTIVAVSSGTGEAVKTIIRLSGAKSFVAAEKVFSICTSSKSRRIMDGEFALGDGLVVGAKIYGFVSPDSYNGDDIIEIHICACGEVVDPTILANRARNQNLYLG